MTRGDRLGHSWRDGRLLFPGLASDFACMIRAALALYEATGERALSRSGARPGRRALDRHYANPDNGGYFLTADDAEGLVVRPGATSDDATPNPNGIAAQNLVRLAVLTGDDAWREKADRLIEGVLGAAGENLIGHASLLNALDLRLRAAEIVVTGSGERADALAAAALQAAAAHRIVLRAPERRRAAGLASGARQDRSAPEGAAFVCVGERCSLPVTQPRSNWPSCPRDGARSHWAQPSARWRRRPDSRNWKHCAAERDGQQSGPAEELIMRIAFGAVLLLASLAPALAEGVRVELNTVENAENRCRMTFVIENKSKAAVDSLKLDLALFNTEGAVYRRMIVDMAPVRAAKTVVKTFATEGDCAQLGSVLVNEVTACTPGEPPRAWISSRCRRA